MSKFKLILASSVIIGAVLLLALSTPPAQKAKAAGTSIFPYIKTAGPGSDLSLANQQWAAAHWDFSSTRKGQ